MTAGDARDPIGVTTARDFIPGRSTLCHARFSQSEFERRSIGGETDESATRHGLRRYGRTSTTRTSPGGGGGKFESSSDSTCRKPAYRTLHAY